MKSKKGSHVGVVLSFVIFITFVVFLYLLVQPTASFKNKGNLLENLENRITLISSNNLTTASVFVDTPGSGCAELNDFFSITGMENNVISIDEFGSILQLEVSGDDLRVETDENFFRVFGSEEFETPTGSLTGCQPLNEGSDYFLGLVRTSEEIYETRIIELIDEYDSNYQGLKETLGVGVGDEFGFSFTYSNGTTIMTEERNVPASISIFVNNVQIQYINRTGARELGILSVRIW